MSKGESMREQENPGLEAFICVKLYQKTKKGYSLRGSYVQVPSAGVTEMNTVYTHIPTSRPS